MTTARKQEQYSAFLSPLEISGRLWYNRYKSGTVGVIDLSSKKPATGAAAAVFSGISAAILSFMLPVSLIITIFGQFGDRKTADVLMFPMIILSVASSAFIDVHFYLKYPAKTAYPISYYAACLILCIISFSFAYGFDFTPLYGVEADTASALFRAFSLRICAANAFSLLLRIGFEFLRYTKSTRV